MRNQPGRACGIGTGAATEMGDARTGPGRLRVLICDSDPGVSDALGRALAADRLVASVREVNSLAAAKEVLSANGADIVFLDFLAFGWYESTDFIFTFRRKDPHVVFVMHVDDEALSADAAFFYGERRRLLVYYRLARHLEGAELAEGVHSVLVHCMMDLGMSAS